MWKWSTTFGVSISFLLLRDHSLQSGRDSSSLFQIPIFGDACLIPPSISISYLVISCFHEISQRIFFFFRLYVNRILFPWGVLDLLAFIPSRSAPLPIGKAVLGQRPSGPFSSSRRLVQIHFFSSSFFAFNCWCVSCWLRLRCPSSFFHFSSIQPSLSFRCEPLKLSCYASLPHPWFGHEPSKADFPLRSSNGNLLSSSNFLEKEKARSATNLIVVASLFSFCGISINRKIRVEIIVLLRVRSCTFHALVRFLFTYLS